jgi:hypothetical protein
MKEKIRKIARSRDNILAYCLRTTRLQRLTQGTFPQKALLAEALLPYCHQEVETFAEYHSQPTPPRATRILLQACLELQKTHPPSLKKVQLWYVETLLNEICLHGSLLHLPFYATRQGLQTIRFQPDRYRSSHCMTKSPWLIALLLALTLILATLAQAPSFQLVNQDWMHSPNVLLKSASITVAYSWPCSSTWESRRVAPQAGCCALYLFMPWLVYMVYTGPGSGIYFRSLLLFKQRIEYWSSYCDSTLLSWYNW